MDLVYGVLVMALLFSMTVALWAAIAAWATWMFTTWWAFTFPEHP